jgi:hypothetical protein
MGLPPIKSKPMPHIPYPTSRTIVTRMQARLNGNLAALTNLGIALSIGSNNSAVAAGQLPPILKAVLATISLQNCSSAQVAVEMINRFLPSVLARTVSSDQALPERYLLKELAKPADGCRYLLEAKPQPRQARRMRHQPIAITPTLLSMLSPGAEKPKTRRT